ncbi:hypothetical protein L208DRAFT_923721 [Tricholoma matsutake]|nr:hypothetical protein L208DRAFT_923721 [Tricholoma matsutake 945]
MSIVLGRQLRLESRTWTQLSGGGIIRSSTLPYHKLHAIIWPSKAHLWPRKDLFRVVASQILCTEMVWIHSCLGGCRSSNMPTNLTLLMLVLMMMPMK